VNSCLAWFWIRSPADVDARLLKSAKTNITTSLIFRCWGEGYSPWLGPWS
jgi:hypothetical protein